MTNSDLVKQIEALQNAFRALEQKFQKLEENSIRKESSPFTWLISDSFLKRSFAVFGHYLVASLIIGIPFYILIIVLMLLFGGFN